MLVDALMPGKNGYEVCREIRQNPALAHTAILLMTGAFEVVDEEKNRQSGADEFIIKPFESQTLIDATNRLIDLTGDRLAMAAVSSAPSNAPESFQKAAAPPPPAAPAVDDVWATGFDNEPAAAPVVPDSFAAARASFAPTAPAPVKATADDDLWGAFDMDEFETVSAPAPAAAAVDDVFDFEAEVPAGATAAVEEQAAVEEIAFDRPLRESVPTATGFEPLASKRSLLLIRNRIRLCRLPLRRFAATAFAEPEVPPAAPPVMPVMAPTPAEPSAPVVAAAPQPPPAADWRPLSPQRRPHLTKRSSSAAADCFP